MKTFMQFSFFYFFVDTVYSSFSSVARLPSCFSRSQLHLSSERHPEYDPRDRFDTSPPASFDPSQFDIFEDGGSWSTNINNPYVAARYINARRASMTSEDETMDPRDRALAADKASQERMAAWVRARTEEKTSETVRERNSFFEEKTKLNNEARLADWKKNNIRSKSDD